MSDAAPITHADRTAGLSHMDRSAAISHAVADQPGFSGLLDDYPGAAAAYSVRLLDKDYTGACLRVRRSSDSSEEDIGFDSNNELDTTALEDFVGSGDGFVVKWYDQSGNGRDQAKPSASVQPQVASGGSVVTSNGYIALDLTGERRLEGGNDSSLTDAMILFVVSGSDAKYLLFDGTPGYSGGAFLGPANDGDGSTTLHSNWGSPSFRSNGGAISNPDRNKLHDDWDGLTVASITTLDAPSDHLGINHYASSWATDRYLHEVVMWEESTSVKAREDRVNTHYSVY